MGHPGHELRVHGWLSAPRRRVFVLTDGSGRAGVSRVPSTTAVLQGAGAWPGVIYGRLTDAQAYAAMIDGRFDLFTGLADELAEALRSEELDYVAGDAPEGFNPTHDVCRLLINAAVELVRRRTGRRLLNYDFLLDGPPGECPEGLRPRALALHLDDRALARKMEAARAYRELAGEVEAALRGRSEEDFRAECLRPVDYGVTLDGLFDAPPYYETYGEKQVAAGRYDRVIRYREHFVPVAGALRRHVGRQG